MADIPIPEMPRTDTIIRSVPENHILLKFRDDAHAELFSDWLSESGWDAFQLWAARR
jgi:hypothetical protein